MAAQSLRHSDSLKAVLINEIGAAWQSHPRLSQAIDQALQRRPCWPEELAEADPSLADWLAMAISQHFAADGDEFEAATAKAGDNDLHTLVRLSVIKVARRARA